VENDRPGSVVDAVVIGAGIAGLSAAWELSTRGRACVVLDARPRPGGVILTERVDGFVIDAGPDALLVQKPAGVALAREIGLGDRLVPTSPPRTAFVVRDGRLVPLPETSFLGIPTRIGPLVTTKLFSWPAKIRMALEVAVPRRTDLDDESIGSFMRRRFGQEVVSYLAEPLLAGIHAGDVERLSMRALFPRLLEAERTSGSLIRSLRALQTARPATGAFLSFAGGLDELVTTLVQKLPAGTVRCDAAVTRVSGRGPFAVELASGEAIETRAVIAATPARVTASLVEAVDADLAVACRHVRYASTATVVLGYARDHVRHPLAGSGFVVPRVERRFLMAGTWVSSKWPHRAPEGRVLLRGFVGGAGNAEALALSDDEIIGRASDELAARLDITGAPVLARVYRWPDATAQHEVGHHRWLQTIDARLAATSGLFVTGSSYRGTGIPDCIADARSVAAEADTWLGHR
jgi:protoporphyrinogen/coproporphyrinogen III oxidase